jgi:hypothetical protein
VRRADRLGRDADLGLGRKTADDQQAAGDLSRVRRTSLAKVCAGWQPEHNPHLLALLTGLTHQLAASSEMPDPQPDGATPG